MSSILQRFSRKSGLSLGLGSGSGSGKDSLWTSVPWQVFAIAAVAAPTLGVVGARSYFTQGGPSAAAAAPMAAIEEEKKSEGFSTKVFGEPSRADLLVMKALDTLASTPIKRSPLAIRQIDQPIMQAPMQAEPGQPSYLGTLSSIMETRDGTVAMIANKMRRPGDMLGGAWQLTSVDGKAGSAIITHSSGLQQRLMLRQKNEQKLELQGGRHP
jgi:hypothetical protein